MTSAATEEWTLHVCFSKMESAGGSTRLETCSGRLLRLLRPLGQFGSAASAVGATSSVVPESCRDATLILLSSTFRDFRWSGQKFASEIAGGDRNREIEGMKSDDAKLLLYRPQVWKQEGKSTKRAGPNVLSSVGPG